MPTVCSAQPYFFFFPLLSQSLFIQLDLKLHPMAVAEEEGVILVNHQLQILNHILRTGDEVEGSVVEVEEDILK